MTDTPNKTSEAPKTLTLSGVVGSKKASQQVRQSVGQGRSKTVTVEVKKKRNFQSKESPQEQSSDILSDENIALKDVRSNPSTDSAPSHETEQLYRSLTAGELAARLQALKGSLKPQTDDTKDETHSVLSENSSNEQESSAVVVRDNLKDTDEPQKFEQTTDEVSSSLSFRERSVNFKAPEVVSSVSAPVLSLEEIELDRKRKDRLKRELEEESEEISGKKAKKKVLIPQGRDKGINRHVRLEAIVEEEDEEGKGSTSRPRAPMPRRMRPHTRVHKNASFDKKEHQKVIRDVIVPEFITVQELANRMAVRGAEVVKSLMKMGLMVSINQVIDADTAELVVNEFGHVLKRVTDADIELNLGGEEDTPEKLLPRPPVVTIMGHVDHGKTSLLDALRSTDVVSGEAGGITQHIGAYQVTLKSGQKITFIDTPGHAAFTEMRARGAHVTDIVVLVVAADDGIKEQTVEALSHAKAAGVPLVVAVNKCDKPDANPVRVREELLQHGIVIEEFGGDVLAVDVSAKENLNLDKLEEAILLQAELLDLRANPNRSAEGVVIEAKLEKGRGPVATVLVGSGTLRSGDIFVAGSHWGRVRSLVNDHGLKIEKALPAMPIEVIGFNSVPLAGDKFLVVQSEERAREIAEFRLHRERNAKNLTILKTQESMDQFFSQIREGVAKELPILLKADVQGSLEAIRGNLEKLSTSEVAVKIIHSAVGGIHESDIVLAKASKAFVIGFNVRANLQARELADKDKIEIRYYSIIYDVLDDVKKALGGLLSPDVRENFLGYAEIRELFNITKVGTIAGCMVTEGIVKRGAKVRLIRDDVVIHAGVLKTLRRFKDEVKEVREGFECGMAFENYQDIRKGDRIECFDVEEIARTL